MKLTCFFSLTSTEGAGLTSTDPESGFEGLEVDSRLGDGACSGSLLDNDNSLGRFFLPSPFISGPLVRPFDSGYSFGTV
jgi:hypothetical protein